MELKASRPEDFFPASWLQAYNEQVEALWWQLVRLNSSIFVLEHIFDFPFDLFQSFPRHFWNLVEKSLFEACVMIIWRVAVDNSFDQGKTLQQLKNDIYQNLLTNELREQFRNSLKRTQFEKSILSLRGKIEEIRHNYVAHFDLRKHTKPTPEEVRQRTIIFSELRFYRDKVNSFFELLCFGEQRLLLPFEYHPDVKHPVGSDSRSDIERILDGIARESTILNLPESEPLTYSLFFEGIQEQDLERINQYREKFGLSPID